MTYTLRELRYVRFGTADKAATHHFLTTITGLESADKNDSFQYYRSDSRAYSVCLGDNTVKPAIGLTVGKAEDLVALTQRLQQHDLAVHQGSAEECSERMVKAFISCTAPNGVIVECVWRPMTSGWRYFPTRDAGVTSFQNVSLRCRDMAANERFWTEIVGGKISDWVGDTAYIRLDEKHHSIALYPSDRDGLMGISFSVEGINNIMQNFYFLQRQQMPILHGPGFHPASEQIFVTTQGPAIACQQGEPLLLTFATGMLEGEENMAYPPRQYRHQPRAYCGWGSYTTVPEFGAGSSE